MIKNLVLITDTYNWIAECSGYILLNPEKFEILQVFNDKSDIGSCNRLCRE